MTWRHSDKYVFLHLIDGECLPNDLIICKGFSFRTEDSLYVFAASSEMIPLVKRDAETLLRDARTCLRDTLRCVPICGTQGLSNGTPGTCLGDTLRGVPICGTHGTYLRDLLTGRRDTLKCVP